MYGLPLSQSDQRTRSVFLSVYNNEKYFTILKNIIVEEPKTSWKQDQVETRNFANETIKVKDESDDNYTLHE